MNICKHIHACAREIYNSFYNDNIFHTENNITEQENLLKVNQTYVQTTDNNDDMASQANLILGLSATDTYKLTTKRINKKTIG